jgi:hypothetical protein
MELLSGQSQVLASMRQQNALLGFLQPLAAPAAMIERPQNFITYEPLRLKAR